MPPSINPEIQFPEYHLGDVVPYSHIIHNNCIVPVTVYTLLGLNNNPAPVHYKPAIKLWLPTFSGKDSDNLTSWIGTAKARFAVHDVTAKCYVQEAYVAFESLSGDWFNQWIKRPGEKSWDKLKTGLNLGFSNKHSKLVVARMWDNLCHKDSVDDYIFVYGKVRVLADTNAMIDEGKVNYIFLKNLKSHVHQLVCDEDCTTLKTAYQEACNAKQNYNSLYPPGNQDPTLGGNQYNYKKHRYKSNHKSNQDQSQLEYYPSNPSKLARINQVVSDQGVDNVIITFSSESSANKNFC